MALPLFIPYLHEKDIKFIDIQHLKHKKTIDLRRIETSRSISATFSAGFHFLLPPLSYTFFFYSSAIRPRRLSRQRSPEVLAT